MELRDGSTKIFLNAQGKGEISEELKAIADSIMGLKNESPLAREIAENVERVKLAKEWRLEYVTFEMLVREREMKAKAEGRAEGKAEGMAEGEAKGRAEGKAEGKAEERINLIHNLMKNMNLTIEQAMNALNIPIEERTKYTKELQIVN